MESTQRKNDALLPKEKKERTAKEMRVLDSKTVVLDENADDLLDIHKYCIEDLA